MIYRAMAHSTSPDWIDRDSMERVVFFEALNRRDAQERLRQLLSDLWRVAPDSIEFYNLEDEHELIANSVGGDETGDYRFFETGMAYGSAMYTGGHEQPLLLLHQNLDRLMRAFLTLPHRGETGLRIALGKFD